jgi:hypothetical protein
VTGDPDWGDWRADDADIYAQRLNGAGVPQWAADGIPLHVQPGQQRHPGVVADGNGGAILVWQEKRNGNYDMRATRVDGQNVTVWPPMTVCEAIHRQFGPHVVSDSAGGAVVVWQDERNNLGRAEFFVQRLDPLGVPLWTPGGVRLAVGMSVGTGTSERDWTP